MSFRGSLPAPLLGLEHALPGHFNQGKGCPASMQRRNRSG